MSKTYERCVSTPGDVRQLYLDVLKMTDVEFYRGYTGTAPGRGTLVDFDENVDTYRHLESGEWGINPNYIPEITIPFDAMFEGDAKDGKV